MRRPSGDLTGEPERGVRGGGGNFILGQANDAGSSGTTLTSGTSMYTLTLYNSNSANGSALDVEQQGGRRVRDADVSQREWTGSVRRERRDRCRGRCQHLKLRQHQSRGSRGQGAADHGSGRRFRRGGLHGRCGRRQRGAGHRRRRRHRDRGVRGDVRHGQCGRGRDQQRGERGNCPSGLYQRERTCARRSNHDRFQHQ